MNKHIYCRNSMAYFQNNQYEEQCHKGSVHIVVCQKFWNLNIFLFSFKEIKI